MSWMDNFKAEMNTTIKISGRGAINGKGADGQPTYATGVTKFNGLCAFWQLSASEIFAYDRIGNPSTHRVILDPGDITTDFTPQDTALINGKTYDIFPSEDILQLGDVTQLTVRIRR